MNREFIATNTVGKDEKTTQNEIFGDFFVFFIWFEIIYARFLGFFKRRSKKDQCLSILSTYSRR